MSSSFLMVFFTWQMESDDNKNVLNKCHYDHCDLYLRIKVQKIWCIKGYKSPSSFLRI